MSERSDGPSDAEDPTYLSAIQSLSQEEVERLTNEINLSLFSEEVILQSQITTDEQGDAYLERLLDMFPSPVQQTYLTALSHATKAGVFGLHAFQFYTGDIPPHPDVATMYPQELNVSILGIGINAQEEQDWTIQIDPHEANDLKRRSHQAAYEVRSTGDTLVQNAREATIEVHMGRTPLSDDMNIKLKDQVRILRVRATTTLFPHTNAIGDYEDRLRAEVTKTVTLESLNISTDSTARSFSDVARCVGRPFHPTQLFTHAIETSYGSTDLNIPLGIGTDLAEAHSRTIEGQDSPTR